MPRTTTLAEEVKTYRKKPIEIQAIQLNLGNFFEVAGWVNGNDGRAVISSGTEPGSLRLSLIIVTLEGEMTGSIGDYIIRGIQGEFYPCKPDIFNATYEEVLP
jgi:hypothetical protein